MTRDVTTQRRVVVRGAEHSVSLTATVLFCSVLLPSLFFCFARVPLGFVCGYPLPGSGELYGGSMFSRSAAADTAQGQATQRANERWGSDTLDRSGRESIGMAVCKKKYTPFVFPLAQAPDGTVRVGVERRLGCRAHHDLRQRVIAQHGLRPGWEPFGQWTIKKAQEVARKEAHRRNKQQREDGNTTTEDDASLTAEDECAGAICLPTHSQNNFRSLFWNGDCLVRHGSMFDDVEQECREIRTNHNNSSNNNNNKAPPAEETSDEETTTKRTEKRTKR